MEHKKETSDVLVKFSDVTKQYGDLVVLDKLNLEIKKNEMVSIIGPSGSGKTTLLNTLVCYCLGVKKTDRFRYRIVDDSKSDQTKSVTNKVT